MCLQTMSVPLQEQGQKDPRSRMWSDSYKIKQIWQMSFDHSDILYDRGLSDASVFSLALQTFIGLHLFI